MESGPKRKSNAGRPLGATSHKPIDWELVKSLAKIQCNLYEVAAVIEVSEDTLSRQCKKVHKCSFKEFMEKYKGVGRVALRRELYQRAINNKHKSDVPLIFALKNWCGFVDKVETENKTTVTQEVIVYETQFGDHFSSGISKEDEDSESIN